MDIPSNPKSLSAFLIEQLGLVNMTISSQSFSFRDLIKYSYIKQTEIDNENILEEKYWEKDFKRKATFEIIFNIYDKLLEEYKNNIDNKKEELKELTIKFSGIEDFLVSADFSSLEDYNKEKEELTSEIISLQEQLSAIKIDKGINNKISNSLRDRINKIKYGLQTVTEQKKDQQQYISKLRLLYNQYQSEIEKKEMAIEGYFAFNKYEFVFCPNCLKPLNITDSVESCCLCGNEKNEEQSELLILKKEIAIIKRKANELVKFIMSKMQSMTII